MAGPVEAEAPPSAAAPGYRLPDAESLSRKVLDRLQAVSDAKASRALPLLGKPARKIAGIWATLNKSFACPGR